MEQPKDFCFDITFNQTDILKAMREYEAKIMKEAQSRAAKSFTDMEQGNAHIRSQD